MLKVLNTSSVALAQQTFCLQDICIYQTNKQSDNKLTDINKVQVYLGEFVFSVTNKQKKRTFCSMLFNRTPFHWEGGFLYRFIRKEPHFTSWYTWMTTQGLHGPGSQCEIKKRERAKGTGGGCPTPLAKEKQNPRTDRLLKTTSHRIKKKQQLRTLLCL